MITRFINLGRYWISLLLAKLSSDEASLQALSLDLARISADLVGLEQDLERQRAQATLWEGRARRAAYVGNDEDARVAIARKLEHQAAAQLYELEVMRQRRVVVRLRQALEPIRMAVNTGARARSLHLVRERRVVALEGLAAMGPYDRPRRTEELEHRENMATALLDYVHDDPVENEFVKREQAEAVEEELAKLRPVRHTNGANGHTNGARA